MATPSLRLTFLKGPRDGETLDYALGSTIRLGRIVRGNEIAVKDAGISTKHLRIASEFGNWVIQDLGSSNGTILNSNPLDADTPVDLQDGDIIKLGECTSIVVNLVVDVQNTRCQANPDPEPVRLVQVKKPARKLSRVSESSILEEEKGLDVELDNKPKSRVRKAKKLGTTDGLEEEENKGNSRRTRNAASIKVEIEDSAMAVENSGKGTKKGKATRNSKTQIVEKSCLGLVNLERAGRAAEEALKEKRITRATRSKKIEIAGDSYLELEMVLNRARKKKKGAEQKPLKSFKDDAEEQDPKCCPVEEDIKNEQGRVVSSTKSVDMVEMDLGKMTLGEFLNFLEVHLPKQINHETENMIEPMRTKTQRVHKYLAEQKCVQAKAFVT